MEIVGSGWNNIRPLSQLPSKIGEDTQNCKIVGQMALKMSDDFNLCCVKYYKKATLGPDIY